MGRPDNRYITDRSINQRLYATPKTYAEQMGQGTRQAAYDQNDELYSQSQFKKPYKEDTYEEMEYFADPFPGYPWDWGWDTPFEDGINNLDEGYVPWHVKFLCSTGNACYGMPDEECSAISCGWPIIGVEIVSQPGGCALSVSGTTLCAACPEGSSGSITFNIVMKAKFQHYGTTITVIGKHYYLTISKCSGCKAPAAVWGVGSDSTVVQSGSANVELDNHNNCDYTWSVSGTGFTLDSSTGISNTVNADASACGSATITAICEDGTTVTGYVRCTTGVWGGWTDGCMLSGTADTKNVVGGQIQLEKTEGKYNQYQIVTVRSDSIPSCDEGNCSANCGVGACNDTYGCTDCLEWACEDVSGYFSCQDWCCRGTGNTCANSGSCWCSTVIRYREWVCA